MEVTANAVQTVNTGSPVVFTDTAVAGNCSIMHREGSGLVTLRGITNQCRARFKITFGGNVGLPTDVTPVTPISFAIAINGEPVSTTTMTSTPATVGVFNSVSRTLFLDVPNGCCSQISVENISASAVEVENASLIVERVA